nr:glycosyltransferase [uncultured Rhodopila sp.]
MNSPAPESVDYAVVLTRSDIDRFEHNKMFAREIVAAFEAAGVILRPMDYIADPRRVFAAMRDRACKLFMCFNGFGSELQFPTALPGQLLSAYTAFDKPVFDFMHDCPAHETMQHQLRSTFPQRVLLITDYGYANLATQLGFPNVLYVPSITFPDTLPSVKLIKGRRFDVLLPISLPHPQLFADRHLIEGGYKSKLYRCLFHDVAEKTSSDWRLDPIAELVSACREIGIMLDWTDSDDRFLLTTLMDYTKFARRKRLVEALSHLPVTVMTDRKVDMVSEDSQLEFIESRSASGLLSLMADSRCVLCPTPHMTGFHERVLGAFTAGAAVVSSPNKVLEAAFVHGRDILFFRDEADAAGLVEALLNDDERLQFIAHNARARASSMFPPERLVETILSLLAIQRHRRDLIHEADPLQSNRKA